MAANLSQDMLAGAALVNYGWQRQERLQALKTQEAYRQMQERQLAAQAQMLTEHASYYQAQRQQVAQEMEMEQSLLLASKDMYNQLKTTGASDEDATMQTLAAMSVNFPQQAQKLSQAYENMARARNLEREAKTKIAEPIQIARELGNVKTRLDEANNQLLEAEVGEGSADADALRSEIGNLQEQYDALKTKSGGFVEPVLKVIDGEKFLINQKTGAIHKVGKNISKKGFIEKQIGNWMRDNLGMNRDEAAKEIGDFYDKYLSEGVSETPTSESANTSSVPRLRYNPSTGKLETVQ